MIPMLTATGIVFALSAIPGNYRTLPGIDGIDKAAPCAAYRLRAWTAFPAFGREYGMRHTIPIPLPAVLVCFAALFREKLRAACNAKICCL